MKTIVAEDQDQEVISLAEFFDCMDPTNVVVAVVDSDQLFLWHVTNTGKAIWLNLEDQEDTLTDSVKSMVKKLDVKIYVFNDLIEFAEWRLKFDKDC